VASGAYLWWYIDALSDDGLHALTIIAFVGSVFSPYYRLARRGGRLTDPENHCAINVSLYGGGGRGPKRWTMTERGRAQVFRDARQFIVGPSRVRWNGQSLIVEIDERAAPIPFAVRGRVVVHPKGLSRFVTPLDAAGRHHWGPIAPCARVEVDLESPAQRWSGHAYVDSNEGVEPIDGPFEEWDWARATLADGRTAVIYDVRPKAGDDHVVAQCFREDGSSESFEAPPRQTLPRTGWRITGTMRSDVGSTVRLRRKLEDTPFYARSELACQLLGEPVTALHETLVIPRLVSPVVQAMLPFRMPRIR
jgi:carotenoid 1,2-hydratase